MNTSILKKCLEELNKKDPRKDYVIGMLETLIETQGTQPPNYYPGLGVTNGAGIVGIIPDMNNFPVVGQGSGLVADETVELGNKYARGSIAPSATVS